MLLSDEPSDAHDFSHIAEHYLTHKEWRRTSTKELHSQVVNDVLIPRWENLIAVRIEPTQIKNWLKSLGVEPGTKEKYKTIMGTVYGHAQSEGLVPLGEKYNPVHYVTGLSFVSDYESIVLTPEQTLRVLEQLDQPEYTMIVLVAVTGMRASELLALRWMDILWDRSEIRIRQTYVHSRIEVGAKTKLSKSSVPMHPILAQLLRDWRSQTAYAQESDFVFASPRLSGKKPRCGSTIFERHLRPAAERAGVIDMWDGQAYLDGEVVRRFGFHVFRHSLTSCLMANGANPEIVRAMLRWTNLNMLAHYTHGFKADKLEAQGSVLQKLVGKEIRLESGAESGASREVGS